MLSERQIDPIGFSIRQAIADSAEPLHQAFVAAITRFIEMSSSISKIFAYARITAYVLDDMRTKKGPPPPTHFHGNNVLPRLVGSLDAIVRYSDAEFLEYEKEGVPSFVFAQATISLWSALEAGIRDMLVVTIGADSALLKREDIEKIQVSLLQFNTMDPAERIEYIVDRIEEKNKSKFSRGVGRFENMLKPFGFGGEVDPVASKELLEFSAVRNCLVHRQGIVDRRFLEACATGQWQLGTDIAITRTKCDIYSRVALQYGATVVSRIDEYYGAKFGIMKDMVARLTSDLSNLRW